MSANKLSFFSALIIHLLLAAALCFSFSQKKESPPVVVMDVLMLEESSREKNVSNNHHPKTLQKDESQHSHKQDFFESQEEAKKASPIFNPLPQIPDDLRDEVFLNEAIARFFIDESGGVVRVELIKPCANPRLNNLLLKSLRNWKFSATKKDSTQDIKVKFKVE